MPGAEQIEISARDGYRLGATLFRPAQCNGRALQIHAAAGVRQEYYAKFAAYLTTRGFGVLTFDYRGVGRSAPPQGRKLAARMRDWAELDASGALDFLEMQSRAQRLMAIGHSFGGVGFGLVAGSERLAAVLAVGSQSCYWRHWPIAWRPGMWLLTHALLPGATHLLGYFPGALMRQGENLPAGIALEWAHWSRNPRYLVGALHAEARFQRFNRPFRLYSIDDDLYAPPAAARALQQLYPNAVHELKHVSPRELGAQRIGHFGFFRERFRDSLWRDAADWLERQE
jgi:predicted alpha/beta hydrolase